MVYEGEKPLSSPHKYQMGRQSLVLLSGQSPTVVYVGEPLRVDCWYTSPEHIHTVSIAMSSFKGRISIEASLKVRPTDNDWFPISLGGRASVDYPITGVGLETSTQSFNFVGRYIWLRARIDRRYVIPDDALPTMVAACGFVDRILLNV